MGGAERPRTSWVLAPASGGRTSHDQPLLTPRSRTSPPADIPCFPCICAQSWGAGGAGRGAAWWFPSAPRPLAPWGRESHRLAPRPPRGGPARPPVPSQLWLGGGPATKPAPCGGCGLRGARQCARGAAPPHTPVLPVAFLSVQRGQKPAAARQAAAAVSTGRTEPLATSWSPAHRGVRVAGGRSGVLPSPPAWGPNVQPVTGRRTPTDVPKSPQRVAAGPSVCSGAPARPVPAWRLGKSPPSGGPCVPTAPRGRSGSRDVGQDAGSRQFPAPVRAAGRAGWGARPVDEHGR